MARFLTKETLLNAVSTTTTSSAFFVGDRRKISMLLFGTGIAGTNTAVFTAQVSNDGTNFAPYGRMITAGSTAVTSTPTLEVNGSSLLVLFSDGDHFSYLKLKCTPDSVGATFSAVLAGID